MKKYFIFTLLILLTACGGKKKRLLTLDSVNTVVPEAIASQYQSVATIDTITPKHGIRSHGIRKTDSAHPLIKLNIGEAASGDFNLSDFYSGAEYIKLKHPVENAGFVNGTAYFMNLASGGRMNTTVHSSADFTGDHIIAGDMIYGYYAYDTSGKYLYKIWSPKTLVPYSETRITQTIGSTETFLSTIIINGNNCLVSLSGGDSKNGKLEMHNISERSVVSRPMSGYPGSVILPNAETYFENKYNYRMPNGSKFMHSYNFATGDTLSVFTNYNPTGEQAPQSVYYPTNEDLGFTKYYNGEATFRQAYCDTIYRVKSAADLIAAYTFDMGDRKLDMTKELFSSAIGKLLPSDWLETEKFILFSFAKGKESASDKTEYLHYVYYKDSGKILSLEKEFPYSRLTSLHNKLFISFTKTQLKEMIDHDSFSSFPGQQQDKMKSLYDGMDVKELLMMIIK